MIHGLEFQKLGHTEVELTPEGEKDEIVLREELLCPRLVVDRTSFWFLCLTDT